MAQPWEQDPVVQTPAAGDQPWAQDQAVGGKFMPNGNGQVLSQGPAEPGMLSKAMSGISDFKREAANAMTMGAADRFNGMFDPNGYPAQAERTRQAGEDLGHYGKGAADLTGGAALSAILPEAALSTVPRAMATSTAIGAAAPVAQSLSATGELPSAKDVATGAATGLVTGSLGSGLGSIGQRPRLDMNTARNLDVLQQNGIDTITVGQATKNPGYLSREANAHGAQDLMSTQDQQFSTAVARHVGIDAPDGVITKPALNQAFTTNGNEMDRLAGSYDMTERPLLLNAFRTAAQEANSYNNAVGSTGAPIVQRTVDRLRQALHRGSLSGDEYQSITSDLAAAARKNTNLSDTAYAIRAGIDDAMGQSITRQNPQDGTAWQQARQQYKNLNTVQQSLGYASDSAAERMISPKDLAAATKATQGKRNYVRGRTDFDDLADAGRVLMTKLPAPTENRSLMQKVFSPQTLGAGAGAYALTGSPMAASAGLIPEVGAGLYNRSNMALRPVTSLSPTATSTGARVGIAAGQAANPFLKAMMGQ